MEKKIDDSVWSTSAKIKREDRSDLVNIIRKRLAEFKEVKGEELEYEMKHTFYSSDYLGEYEMRTNINLTFDAVCAALKHTDNIKAAIDSPLHDHGGRYLVMAIEQVLDEDEWVCFREY